MKRMANGLLGVATLVTIGCSGPLTRVAPQPPEGVALTKEARGTACGVNLFGVIPISVNDRAERAYRQAVERSGGSGLTNTSVVDRWYWIYVGHMVCTDISGVGFTQGG